ncbi:hypothetical protein [Vibrio sagamiensis]|uniref:Uncharacterized protein n=1 Tax=Vibrio sagamiensis NBRC 104589 TaxID=1219064 RepID=A0A511QJL4_9VIBR|nr:hypothetical protein [Vibrio sagamiensis]GEM77520.1 hypothetical protein VSA01S_36320 [Vibrio sagamiensis NBRC 104589]
MISSVISFMGAWEKIRDHKTAELESLRLAIENYVNGNVTLAEEAFSYREAWEKALFDQGWDLSEKSVFNNTGRKVSVRFAGPTRNGLAAQIGLNNPEFLNRWLYNYANMAVRHDLCEVAILVVPVGDSVPENDRNRTINRRTSFEHYLEQLEMLSPLSLGIPFVIIGYSKHPQLFEVTVYEIESEYASNHEPKNVVVNKSIEFPPEYHQAGVGILNFFSSYLSQNYPDQDATVKIEQRGMNVRMIVESEDGNSEVIEKALHEYEQIMTGKESASKFTNNDKLVLDMRSELRVAKARIESQQDIMLLQNQKLQTSEARVDSLLSIVGIGLQRESVPINVQVNPCIQNHIAIMVNSDVSESLGCLSELQELLSKDDDVALPISDLTSALERIEAEQNTDVVRKSSAMAKFSRFVDSLLDKSSSIRKAVDATQQGYEVALDLVKKYNKVASWCGLPTVPTFE